MSALPKSNDTSELRRIFQSVWDALSPWLTAPIVDLHGRRIGNAGDAISPRDYLTKGQAEKDFAALDHSHDAARELLRKSVRIDTFANRGLAAAWNGTLFEASDQNYVGWASNGSAWIYAYGINNRTQAQLAALATLLGTNDTSYLVRVTTYEHLLRWSGSAWSGGPGFLSGYYVLADEAPRGGLWQIADGSTVDRLNADGTVTAVTVKDVTTARYVKVGLSSAAPAAASGTSGATSGGTPAGTNSAPTFTGDAAGLVANTALGAENAVAHPYTPSGTVSAPAFTGSALATHTHTPGTLEPTNVQEILFYRR